MKISIKNFKSIKNLQNFTLKPITILSGVNSSGKSSFIQLLLLLKQTVELESAIQPLYLSGEYFKVRKMVDLLHEKNITKILEISFEYSKEDFAPIKSSAISILNSLGNFNCKVEFHYSVDDSGKARISHFSVKYTFSEGKNPFLEINSATDNIYSINSNDEIFGKGFLMTAPKSAEVTFLSIYPTFFNEEITIDSDGGKEYGEKKGFIELEGVKQITNSFLREISYIGPLREEPKEEYFISGQNIKVGTKGEFVAQILSELGGKEIDFFKIGVNDEGKISYLSTRLPLLEFVKYWLCEVFKLALDIHIDSVDDSYRILLTNQSKIEVNIRHVGFGISQILPILVDGLLLSENGTLVLEQPEIHLHPKVQSLLFDFLYGITLKEKRVVVETHSSHFITRMRRRVAEDIGNSMKERINLTFIEDEAFRSIQLDDFGTLDYFPADFIEASSEELNAIISAQMNKKISS
ncbi:MAG: AAA family ATPase [Imperialibacter sp.]|uniref:AAA family ATPase n=1 Tax=Imperialibacter sp. TaxID=2038411 RepID=UPI0032EC0F7A